MELKEIVKYLNERFNQDSPEYSIFMGAKPQVIRLDEETAISLWACGVIVCQGSSLSFIQEDDGFWYTPEYVDKENYSDWIRTGLQDSFCIGWAESFMNAMKDLKEYVDKNGEPVYFSGTNTICYYELKRKA